MIFNIPTVISDDEKFVFMDALSGRYFKSTFSEIRKIFAAFSKTDTWVCLNRIYKALGFPEISSGDIYGVNFETVKTFSITPVEIEPKESHNYIFVFEIDITTEEEAKRENLEKRLKALANSGWTTLDEVEEVVADALGLDFVHLDSETIGNVLDWFAEKEN